MIEATPAVVLVAVIALFTGGLVKGAVGFGMPLVVTPVLLFWLPLPAAVSLIALPVLVANVQQCWLTRRSVYVLRMIWPMIVVNAVVILVGSRLIVTVDGDLIRTVVGALILVHVFAGDRSLEFLIAGRSPRMVSAVTGLFSGALGSMTSFYSFPSVQVLHGMRLTPEAFVFAVGLLLSSGFATLLVGLAVHGFDVGGNVVYSAFAAVPVMAGIWFGSRIRNSVSAPAFRRVVKIVLGLTGASLVLRGLLQVT